MVSSSRRMSKMYQTPLRMVTMWEITTKSVPSWKAKKLVLQIHKIITSLFFSNHNSIYCTCHLSYYVKETKTVQNTNVGSTHFCAVGAFMACFLIIIICTLINNYYNPFFTSTTMSFAGVDELCWSVQKFLAHWTIWMSLTEILSLLLSLMRSTPYNYTTSWWWHFLVSWEVGDSEHLICRGGGK